MPVNKYYSDFECKRRYEYFLENLSKNNYYPHLTEYALDIITDR